MFFDPLSKISADSPVRKDPVFDLAELRAKIRKLAKGEGLSEGMGQERLLPLGAAAIDLALGGGLPLGRLHEIASDGLNVETGASGAGFAACILSRLFESDLAGNSLILWSFTQNDLYAPGLARFGLDPASVLFVHVRRDEEVLAVLEEALRLGIFCAVLGEVGNFDLISARRLQLACEKSGSTGFVLRRWPYTRKQKARREGMSVTTRWRVVTMPSETGEPELPTLIGQERWQLDLTQKNGRNGSWIVEAGDATGHVRVVTQLGDHQAQSSKTLARAPATTSATTSATTLAIRKSG